MILQKTWAKAQDGKKVKAKLIDKTGEQDYHRYYS